MAVREETYLKLLWEDPEGQWELVCGRPRRKPPMSVGHNFVTTWLLVQLAQQIDRERFDVRANMGRVRRSAENYFIPDVYIIPRNLQETRTDWASLEVYDAPLPLVVEVWSPSTGEYDVDAKLPEYQRRGDLEIWRIHPVERTLTAWRRRPDGSYAESRWTGREVQLMALPEIIVDLDALFA